MHFVDAVEICLKQKHYYFHKTLFFSFSFFFLGVLIDFWCFEIFFLFIAMNNVNAKQWRENEIDKDRLNRLSDGWRGIRIGSDVNRFMAMKTAVTLKSQNFLGILQWFLPYFHFIKFFLLSTIHFNIEQYFKEKNFIEKIVKKFTESQ